MYMVGVEGNYNAAHFIRDYGGRPEPLHGHRYRVEAVFTANAVASNGIAVDFAHAKKELDRITGFLDHCNLNDLPEFATLETSAENQARWIFDELRARMGRQGGDALAYVKVWETPEMWALYSPRAIGLTAS